MRLDVMAMPMAMRIGMPVIVAGQWFGMGLGVH
jgi:hypothetical protein